jgi:signal transduction histidine kinase
MNKRLSTRGEPRADYHACLALVLLACWAAFATGVSPARADDGRVAKVVRQYALTSANDFPQRDPQNWRLLGSNDGGKTWVTLDVRQGEVFHERHQRRLFKTDNKAGFKTYRLRIDRVLDPNVANSVQLAEIELMGASEDDLGPTPVFSDIITVRGDNPPSESVQKLFDGRAETKWLDRPSNRTACASWIQWEYVVPGQVVISNISRLQALRARAGDGYRVQLEAVVAGRSDRAGGVCIADATGCLELGELANGEALRPGQRIGLAGTSEWSAARVGIKAARLELHGAPPLAPEKIELEQPLAPGENLKWVEIQGELRYRRWAGDQTSFDVQDGGASMRAYLCSSNGASPLPASGTRVAVRGICQGAFTDQGQWVAGSIWASETESLTQSEPKAGRTEGSELQAKASPAWTNTFTKIEQIRRLTQQQLSARPHVKIRGVVTELMGGFVQDDTAGIEVAFPPEQSRKVTEEGMFVEVEGWGGLGDGGNPIISADQIRVLGKGKLPQPQQLSLNQLISGRRDAQWIELEGVVRSTDGAHLLMICSGREVTASIGEGAAGVVNQLVDAVVRVRGVGVTALDEQGRVQGIHLLIPSLEHVEILEQPQDPSKLAIRPIGSLLGMSGPRESSHQVRVQGIVTLQDDQRLFLTDDTGSAMAVFKQDVVLDARFGRTRWLFWRTAQDGKSSRSRLLFAPGERVDVVGFPETRGYSPVLTEVTVKKLGGLGPLTSKEVTANRIADGRLDSALVTLDGVLRGQNTIGAHIVMVLEWHDRMLQVLVPSGETGVSRIVPGSRLQVTGICQSDPAPYAELGLRVAAVRILTRSASDVQVLARPSWWTVRRALTVMGVMGFLIVAALVWIEQLRTQVEERTAQLAAEIQLREQTERQRALEQERARIAKDLHDDLGANLTQIVFLSQRVEAARNDPQEDRRWFGLIPATARRTIQSLDEIVWAINPRHDSLESLANYLSQFAQEHLTLAGIRCVLDVPTVLPAVNLNAEFRHNLLLAAREALQNVVAHAAANSVRVSLRLDDAALEIVIADNGRGFAPSSVNGEGNGLSNMRRRLEHIGGRFEIESAPAKGTTVRFVIPRDQLHDRVIGTKGVSAPG